VDWLLEDEAMKRHVSKSTRPGLDNCTQQQFEADLVAFLQAKGDDQLATFVKEKRITWCVSGTCHLSGRHGGAVHAFVE
jgi:hypothetical protein